MKKLVYLIGIDGSGKTTNAEQLVAEGMNGYKILYMYCQYRPILLLPFKIFAKLFLMKSTNEFLDYDKYIKKKKDYTKKMKFLTRVYSLVWYFDYILQAWFHLLIIKSRKADLIILDRYYLDSIVNLACLQDLNSQQMVNDAKLIGNFLQKADLHIFLDVSEENAFSRKNDIQSVEYLKERRQKYFELAKQYNFKYINANLAKDIVYKKVKESIKNLVLRSHTKPL